MPKEDDSGSNLTNAKLRSLPQRPREGETYHISGISRTQAQTTALQKPEAAALAKVLRRFKRNTRRCRKILSRNTPTFQACCDNKQRGLAKMTDGINNHINEIFDRISLEQIRAFILTGVKSNHQHLKDEQYSLRLKNASDPIYNRINSLYANDRGEREEATDEITEAVSAFQEVYMDIGMKAGARLLYQLMVEDERGVSH